MAPMPPAASSLQCAGAPGLSFKIVARKDPNPRRFGQWVLPYRQNTTADGNRGCHNFDNRHPFANKAATAVEGLNHGIGPVTFRSGAIKKTISPETKPPSAGIKRNSQERVEANSVTVAISAPFKGIKNP